MEIDHPPPPAFESNHTAISSDNDETDDVEMTTEATTSQAPILQNQPVSSPDLFKIYYQRLYPIEDLYTWWNYDNLWTHREFSFTLLSPSREEIYMRYQSFATATELQTALVQKTPVKIDIGAVYNHLPKNRHTVQNLQPMQRELVFDIDLTDYDPVRRCGCQNASICSHCWFFMKCAVKVVHRALVDDFGYQHIAWFYSGRRGIHCWVCDKSARELTDQGRSSVAKYLSVQLGTEKTSATSLPLPLHPSLQSALDVLEPLFEQHILDIHKVTSSDHFLEKLPERIRENLQQRWSKHSELSHADKWKEVKQHLKVYKKSSLSNKSSKTLSNTDKASVDSFVHDTVFRYSYPRLDIEVSKKRNHLLKSPFCVHPKTGRICVFIEDMDTFDPFRVPTLHSLLEELDAHDGQVMETSLGPYLSSFRRLFLQPLQSSVRSSVRQASEQQAALTGDF